MLFKGIINFQVAGEIIHAILSIGSADECFPANAVLWRHKPFNKANSVRYHYILILSFSVGFEEIMSFIFLQQGLITIDFGFKIAHRGDKGSHRGKRKLFCVLEREGCVVLVFCSSLLA